MRAKICKTFVSADFDRVLFALFLMFFKLDIMQHILVVIFFIF